MHEHVASDKQTQVGNPPFGELAVVDGFLDRCYELLPEGGRVGFILPSLAFGSSRRVIRYSDRWSLEQQLLPRDIFPRTRQSLTWALFSKDRRRLLVGFALYPEMAQFAKIRPDVQATLRDCARPPWREIMHQALRAMNGEATTSQLVQWTLRTYDVSANHWIDAKFRQVGNRHFRRNERGRWSLN